MPDPLKTRAERHKGINTVVAEGALRELALDLLVLGPGESIEIDTGDYETAMVPFSADATVEVSGALYTLRREDVFNSPGSCLVVPAGSAASVKAASRTELALCKARSAAKGEALFVEKGREKTVGRGAWERKVVDLVGSSEKASRIVLGETFNRPGGWSSFPPHKHDTAIPGAEARMEEIYLFRLNPSDGFGTQTIYGMEGSHSFTIGDYDAVTIPWGYHPVAAMPGYALYYLWFLAGDARELRPNTDPRYKWLEEA